MSFSILVSFCDTSDPLGDVSMDEVEAVSTDGGEVSDVSGLVGLGDLTCFFGVSKVAGSGDGARFFGVSRLADSVRIEKSINGSERIDVGDWSCSVDFDETSEAIEPATEHEISKFG